MHLSTFISSVAFAALAACGGSNSASKVTRTPATPISVAPGAASDGDPSCPVAVAGTSVSVEDTATGAALVFVTTGDDGELRRRVAAMAAVHNEQHAAMGPLPTGAEDGGGHDHHAHHAHHAQHAQHAQHAHHATQDTGHTGGMIGVHSAASAEEIGDGARLVFVVAPGDVATLQSELRMHAQHLSGGTCEMVR